MAAEVFVSYSRSDRDRVLPWVQLLQQAGISLWMDESDITGARLWRQEIAEALRLGEDQQRRPWRRVDRAGELAELRAFGIDALGGDRLPRAGVRDLAVQVGDLRFDAADLALEVQLLGGVVLQGLLELLLGRDLSAWKLPPTGRNELRRAGAGK